MSLPIGQPKVLQEQFDAVYVKVDQNIPSAKTKVVDLQPDQIASEAFGQSIIKLQNINATLQSPQPQITQAFTRSVSKPPTEVRAPPQQIEQNTQKIDNLISKQIRVITSTSDKHQAMQELIKLDDIIDSPLVKAEIVKLEVELYDHEIAHPLPGSNLVLIKSRLETLRNKIDNLDTSTPQRRQLKIEALNKINENIAIIESLQSAPSGSRATPGQIPGIPPTKSAASAKATALTSASASATRPGADIEKQVDLKLSQILAGVDATDLTNFTKLKGLIEKQEKPGTPLHDAMINKVKGLVAEYSKGASTDKEAKALEGFLDEFREITKDKSRMPLAQRVEALNTLKARLKTEIKWSFGRYSLENRIDRAMKNIILLSLKRPVEHAIREVEPGITLAEHWKSCQAIITNVILELSEDGVIPSDRVGDRDLQNLIERDIIQRYTLLTEIDLDAYRIQQLSTSLSQKIPDKEVNEFAGAIRQMPADRSFEGLMRRREELGALLASTGSRALTSLPAGFGAFKSLDHLAKIKARAPGDLNTLLAEQIEYLKTLATKEVREKRKEVDFGGEGNCLIYSLCSVDGKSKEDHIVVRQQIAKQMQSNYERYAHLIADRVNGDEMVRSALGLKPGEMYNKEKHFEAYITWISTVSVAGGMQTWGSDPEIQAYADLIGCSIIVQRGSGDENSGREYITFEPLEKKDTRVLLLRNLTDPFTGVGFHYRGTAKIRG